MGVLDHLEPKAVFSYFETICRAFPTALETLAPSPTIW